MAEAQTVQPTFYIPHGGGPCFFMEGETQVRKTKSGNPMFVPACKAGRRGSERRLGL